MADPTRILQRRFATALKQAFGPEWAGVDPMIRVAQNPRFGDYQANVAMGLAKKLGRKPREVAAELVDHLDVGDVCSQVEIAGPGFINLTLSADHLRAKLLHLLKDDRLGVESTPTPQTVVIDYSSPNVAKQMHVGHLRSTVIGDALARTLSFLGHHVIRHNHIGDWGTQFGMLIEHLTDPPAEGSRGGQGGVDAPIEDLNAFYQEAKKRFDDDPAFADRARKRVVALQSGDAETLACWRRLVEVSKDHFNGVYRRLGVTLSDADIRPESFYNPLLPEVVDTLAGITTVDAGAVCIFVPGFRGPDDKPVPLIVRKSDGGFGYATTDLAAIRDRVCNLGADRIMYVVDSRQSDHFGMVFWAATQMGWLGEGKATAEHVRFGTILGEDNRPFKTRTGDTVRLIDLLDEAERRVAALVAEKNPDLSSDERATVARIVGIGAVKYADLSGDRIKDYVFSWDRMLALEGNTAPYLQYAYARIQSIFRKAGVSTDDIEALGVAAEASRSDEREAPFDGERVSGALRGAPAGAALGASPAVVLDHASERALLLRLLQLSPAVNGVAEASEPHRLCTYLYELAAAFSTFYNACAVIKADDPAIRNSRLALCLLTGRALALGLSLLGIETLDRM